MTYVMVLYTQVELVLVISVLTRIFRYLNNKIDFLLNFSRGWRVRNLNKKQSFVERGPGAFGLGLLWKHTAAPVSIMESLYYGNVPWGVFSIRQLLFQTQSLCQDCYIQFAYILWYNLPSYLYIINLDLLFVWTTSQLISNWSREMNYKQKSWQIDFFAVGPNSK